MKSSPQRTTAQWLKAATLLFALFYIGLYAFTVFSRVTYPYELQWMEGGMVDHIRRIHEGQPLYVSPTIDFVPYIYPPLYYYLAAGISYLTGVGFLPLRLISLVSSFGALALIAAIIRQETHNPGAAVIGAGLFAATYAISDAWLDIARVDTLFLFLLLLAVYVVRFAPERIAPLIGGLLFALAALTKQTALPIAGAVALALLLTDWRKGLIFAVIASGITEAVTLLINTLSGGWYMFYVFDLPGQHAWVNDMIVGFWRYDLLPVVIAGGFGVLYFTHLFRRGEALPRPNNTNQRDVQYSVLPSPGIGGRAGVRGVLFYTLLTAAMIGSAWLSRLHEGGSENVLFPAFAIIAVLFGLGIHAAAQTKLPLYAVYALCIIQFAILIYNPRDYIPTRADRAAGDYLIETIQNLPGDVLVFQHGYYAALAGKPGIHAHRMAVEDVMRGTDEHVKALLQASIDDALRTQRYNAIFFDGTHDNFILVDYYFRELKANYIGRGEIFPPEMRDDLWPLVGLSIRPYYIFVPRDR